ncbi:MAG: hypothetical protein JST85_27745 [Acidobacteria bacterium]|nr:hypothetical protein [Acidobacteriota bacterium]
MRDLSVKEWTKRRSYIKQMVATASARPVPEPESDADDTDLEELDIGLEDKGNFDDWAETEDFDKLELDEDFALEEDE